MKMKALVGFLTLVHVSQQSPTVSVNEGVKSVQLPCQDSRETEDTTVVWHRHGSNPSIVHKHRHRFQTPFQNQHYSGRTSMSDDALETGDLSLTLEEPHHSDSGVYLCIRIRKGEELFPRYKVELQVKVPQHNSTIRVYEGAESVQLPCQSSWFPSDDTTVLWSRIGFNPSTVHQHLDVEEPRFQNQHYSDRTSTPTYALITGDFSLILKEPQLSDSGVYTCHVHNKEKEMLRVIVRLQVTERPTFPPELYLMLAVCLALAVAALGWFKTITVSSVVVKEGVWFVKLPYKTIVPLPEDVTVEWSRCAPEPMRVHKYCNGNNHLVRQDEFYCDRTKMQEEPLKTRDLSLTLREPCYRDSGTYICTVHKDREVWTQKVVRLRVNVPQEVVKVGDRAKCVTLPFKTRARLPADATVKWKRFELSNSLTVHVYQNGQDMSEEQDDSYRGRTKRMKNPLQAGDLSLTLINPSHEDIGAYTCTVERDGDVIWERSVRLKLKGFWF
ncbi:butyrophilin-like protein 2 isoform X2 [Trematomus bernacchii]|uniref:butyrophilin-like protein 2 isoform X2 n=1 Tax=Trematomus bernacchii TaxID=40690 RepID=UPI00146CDF23|nr:butyrophilin-like protein 2 isoform X2 [Trematomus bernacchii]